jgi:hypothetical protein
MGQIYSIAECHPTAFPKHYVWSFPGAPVKVQLNLGVVDRLQQQMPPKGSTSRERGVLLGRAVGQTTEICDFESFSSSGPLTKQSVTALIPASSEHSPVGYYRVHYDDVLKLNEDDLALAEALFADPHQVFLLIQLSDSGPANATFFFWDEGRMCGDFPFLEFPFDASQLAAAAQHKTQNLLQKVQARPAAADSATFSDGCQVPQSKTIQKAAFWLLVALLSLVAVTAGWLFPRNSAAVLNPASVVTSKPPVLLLNAEMQNGDLRLTWNRVGSATSGVLSIQDGTAEREISLDSLQVHSGSILYSPITDQVHIGLVVSGPENTASGSLLVILREIRSPLVQTLEPKGLRAGQVANPRPRADDVSRPSGHEPVVPPAAGGYLQREATATINDELTVLQRPDPRR